MRKYIFIVIALTTLKAQGQFLFPEKEGKVVYEEVIEVDKTKDQLYNSAKHWMVTIFNDANEVIQLDDKESGKIIGKGVVRHTQPILWTSVINNNNFTIEIDCKEGKYRYRIFDIVVKTGVMPSGVTLDQMNAVIRKDISGERVVGIKYTKQNMPLVDEKIKSLAESLKTEMAEIATKDDF